MLEADELDDDRQQFLHNQCADLFNKLNELSSWKTNLRNESQKLLNSNRNGKRQIAALYDQVGDFKKDKVVISVDDMTTTHSDLTQSTLEVGPTVGDFKKDKEVISVDDMTTTHSDLTQPTLEVRPTVDL